MARRLLSEHFKRDGSPKRSFTRVEAVVEADRCGKNAYLCSFCKTWHVGGNSVRP